MKLARSEHRGVPGVAGDVRAVKCAHLVLEHKESEHRGVTGVASDEARATNSLVNWSAAKSMNLAVRPVDRWRSLSTRWSDHLDDDPAIQTCRMGST